jgi:hypothetical protein
MRATTAAHGAAFMIGLVGRETEQQATRAASPTVSFSAGFRAITAPYLIRFLRRAGGASIRHACDAVSLASFDISIASSSLR